MSDTGVSPCFANCGEPACQKLGCVRVYNAENREATPKCHGACADCPGCSDPKCGCTSCGGRCALY